jgi:hypothetical protein
MALAPTNIQQIGNELAIQWSDGGESYLNLELIRRACPCAACGGEPDVLGKRLATGGHSYRRQLSARQFRRRRRLRTATALARWTQHWDLQFPILATVGFVGAEIEIVPLKNPQPDRGTWDLRIDRRWRAAPWSRPKDWDMTEHVPPFYTGIVTRRSDVPSPRG